MKAEINSIISMLHDMDIDERIESLNYIKKKLHEISPFKNEPVDCVLWVKNDQVVANDYNPNKVAPPEMELLEVSILNDGYTQPIVTWNNPEKGTEQSNKNDRIASTIRHNRARGKHQVDAMSEIVIELKNRNWTNKRISKQLGMDEEEVLRLCQVSGLEHLFSDDDFSKAWESSDYVEKFTPITDDLDESILDSYRIPNENDESRIFHTYDKWECHKAGFYASRKKDWTNEQCEQEYVKILTDLDLFAKILDKLIIEWKHSCEHYLTNRSMNRIAWLGQAAVCYHSGVPSKYSYAWSMLTEDQQNEANDVALKALNKWMELNDRNKLDIEEALSIGRQTELY